jgi:hypothetical protein
VEDFVGRGGHFAIFGIRTHRQRFIKWPKKFSD